MNTSQALQWELHAPGSLVVFTATRDDRRYDVVVRRNDTVVLADVAEDSAALLQKSSRLRSHLQHLGYAPKPPAEREWQLTGGVCWGPGTPFDFSVLSAIG